MTDTLPLTSSAPATLRVVASEIGRVDARVDLGRWARTLLAADLLAGVTGLAGSLAVRLRIGASGPAISTTAVLLGLAVLVWPALLAACGAYDRRFLAAGARALRSVGQAAVGMVGLLSFATLVLQLQPPRTSILVGVPAAAVLTALLRHVVRRQMHSRIAAGHPIYRTLVVGRADEVAALARHIARVPWAGFAIVGSSERTEPPAGMFEAKAYADELAEDARAAGADTIAVAGSGALPPGALRALAWRLEGTGIHLVMAPTVADVTGPRILMRPVDGLPLLHVEDPELRAGQRVMKACVDRVGAALLLVALSPLLLVVAVAVRLSSPGPVVYRQVRAGHRGVPFSMLKFRTMVDGADRMDVAHLNENDLLFKVRDDPRVTRVGGFLRRHSLDEVPQLVNVLRGDMSLVGPRPPLLSEVERYHTDAHRRLLVKPGMTGLWQVGGRSELGWEETVRLDLYYVENWSVAMDLLVLWKTLRVVVRPRGAW